ncbi:molybdopterin-synthase adenylyltransferase MoeB [Shewanella avicenniae]|uniref:Molybdopterin-synthase adenylyltransferase MoeB n=1 Tax=Shewanella avicenniae TaxID=2814294 RepID=A0ABX7QSG4_9GAMM|nr:molybdopterin-synthase adenylyltransferase MoeB [Shewanella avicenniae]QSX33870.1 molybdopterin-synthase adenylyltransferase MoeB [Shewanella avicenniae]
MDEILSDSELMRYSRQISLKGMDIDGQELLKQARVLMIGAGGLGCTAALYLTVAGIGHLTLVDFDTVDVSNLQRQVLHTDANVGQAKVDSAKASLLQHNPHLSIDTINAVLDDPEIDALVAQHTIVVDCTDNLMVRNQLNQACFNHKVPLVSAAAIRMEGLITVFNYQAEQPCYHCFSSLFGEQQLSCVEAGILAPVVGMMGCLEATEAIKVITGMGKPLYGRILMVDAMTMEFREMKLPKQPNCAVCSQ